MVGDQLRNRKLDFARGPNGLGRIGVEKSAYHQLSLIILTR
jgi:hypothetical protein